MDGFSCSTLQVFLVLLSGCNMSEMAFTGIYSQIRASSSTIAWSHCFYGAFFTICGHSRLVTYFSGPKTVQASQEQCTSEEAKTILKTQTLCGPYRWFLPSFIATRGRDL